MFKFVKFALISSLFFVSLPLFSVEGSVKSQLDELITPEIKSDKFYYSILKLCEKENLKSILEIGSSSGEGSTEAFVKGIEKNPSKPTLYCIELSLVRFQALQKHYQNYSFVKCYNASSVPLEAFPKEEEVINFYRTTPSTLNHYSLETVLGWLKQDIEFLKQSNAPKNGIELIKKENNIENFDLVLIDGSEFTGKAELQLLYGARYILLDDIDAFKNYENYRRLFKDPAYTLFEEDHTLRNGYAIFKKKL